MKDEYTVATADDVFAKLLPELALFAVDADINPAVALTGAIPRVEHPFICETGMVVCGLEPYPDISAMCRSLTECMRHSFRDEGPGRQRARFCRMHPVVTDTLLAAFALGGPEAVTTRHRGIKNRPESYHVAVYEHWTRVLQAFAKSVRAYERSLLEQDSRTLSKATHLWWDMPGLEANIPVLLKHRPKGLRKRKR